MNVSPPLLLCAFLSSLLGLFLFSSILSKQIGRDSQLFLFGSENAEKSSLFEEKVMKKMEILDKLPAKLEEVGRKIEELEAINEEQHTEKEKAEIMESDHKLAFTGLLKSFKDLQSDFISFKNESRTFSEKNEKVEKIASEKIKKFWGGRKKEIEKMFENQISNFFQKSSSVQLQEIEKKMKKKIFSSEIFLIDAFLFNGEFSILDLRLRTLGKSRVDLFLLVESACTFTGGEKETRFLFDEESFFRGDWRGEEGRKSDSALLGRPNLLHFRVPCSPESELPPPGALNRREMGKQWVREGVLRREVGRIIKGFSGAIGAENIVFLLSDVDEIPKAQVLPSLLFQFQEELLQGEVLALEADFFMYNLRCRRAKTWTVGPRMASLGLLSRVSSDSMRLDGEEREGYTFSFSDDNRELFQVSGRSPELIAPSPVLREPCRCFNVIRIKNAAWHFSYFLRFSEIRRKVKSYSHSEFSWLSLKNDNFLERIVSECTDFTENSQNLLSKQDVQVGSLPPLMARNLEFWEGGVQRGEDPGT